MNNSGAGSLTEHEPHSTRRDSTRAKTLRGLCLASLTTVYPLRREACRARKHLLALSLIAFLGWSVAYALPPQLTDSTDAAPDPRTAASAPAPSETVPATTPVTLPLARLMTREGPVRLQGASATYTLSVPVARREVIREARLHLEFTNSVSLLDARSQLVVLLNDHVIVQMPLSSHQPEHSADIRVPIELLKPGYNSLTFSAAQHYTERCEDAAAPELWTEIDTERSTLALDAELAPLRAPTLAQLNELFDPKLRSPQRLIVVTVGDRISERQLEWGGLLAQAVALRLQYLPAKFEHRAASAPGTQEPGASAALDLGAAANATDADLLLVGVREQLSPYLSAEQLNSIAGSYLGVAALATDPRQFVLIVSGRTEAEVTRAARALGHLSFPYPDTASINIDALELPAVGPYAAARRATPNGVYRFAEFGFAGKEITGSSSEPVVLDFTLPPDLHSHESAEVTLRLHMAYGAGLRRDSSLDIALNGRFERAIALTSESGAAFRAYEMTIPLRSFRPGPNTLQFEAQLAPLVKGECTSVNTSLRFTLFPDSTLTVPSAVHYLTLPDLHLFARTGFPYDVAPEGRDSTLYVASSDSRTVAAAWTLAAKLAQIKAAPLGDMRLTFTTPEAAHHWLLVGTLPAVDPRLLDGAPLDLRSGRWPYASEVTEALDNEPGRLRRGWTFLRELFDLEQDHRGSPVVWITQRGGLGQSAIIQQYRSPRAGDRVATAILASDPVQLQESINQLVEPAVWSQLNGDVALWRSDARELSWQRAGKRFTFGSVGMSLRMEYFFSRHPFLLGASAALTLLLLSVALMRLLVGRRRRMHHDQHRAPK